VSDSDDPRLFGRCGRRWAWNRVTTRNKSWLAPTRASPPFGVGNVESGMIVNAAQNWESGEWNLPIVLSPVPSISAGPRP
jgi:hypothetical protein